jgi:hypothetical protein
VKTKLGERDSLQLENETTKRDLQLRTAADNVAEGVRYDFTVLRDLVTHPERGVDNGKAISFKMKEVEEGEGDAKKKVERPVVVRATVDGKSTEEVLLSKYAEERVDWKPYLGALRLDAEDEGGGGTRTTATRFLDQTRTGGGGGGSKATKGAVDATVMVGDFNKARNVRPNPLEPAAPAGK